MLRRHESCPDPTPDRHAGEHQGYDTLIYALPEALTLPKSRVRLVTLHLRKQFDTQPKRLIFQGRILNKDDQTLAECKLKDGLTVVVQAAPAGTTVVSPTPSSAPSPAPPNPSPGLPAAAARAPPVGGQQRGTVPGIGAASTHVGAAVSTIRGQSPEVARECFSTLIKVIDNIIAHPMEEKYRRIKRANAGFRRKVRSHALSSGHPISWRYHILAQFSAGSFLRRPFDVRRRSSSPALPWRAKLCSRG